MAILVALSLLLLAWCFQGDASRDPRPLTRDLIRSSLMDRNAVPKDVQRWPSGIIPFKIDRKLGYLKGDILDAMAHISAHTCIQFVPWDRKVKAYLKITEDDECYSFWGYTEEVQTLSLADGCDHVGIILHELMHTLGFDHEQNRSDRDKYLDIHWDNIEPDNKDQFQKLKTRENRLLNKFDFDSIMIYGERTFSKDGFSKTMTPKQKPGKKKIKLLDVYQKTKLSNSDVQRINMLYECDQKKKG